MRQTVIAKYHDGKTWNALGIIVEHEDADLDVVEAIKDAATEFAATLKGQAVIVDVGGNFNYGDFVDHVPNSICENHGFSVVDTFQTDLVVDHDERLIPY